MELDLSELVARLRERFPMLAVALARHRARVLELAGAHGSLEAAFWVCIEGLADLYAKQDAVVASIQGVVGGRPRPDDPEGAAGLARQGILMHRVPGAIAGAFVAMESRIDDVIGIFEGAPFAGGEVEAHGRMVAWSRGPAPDVAPEDPLGLRRTLVPGEALVAFVLWGGRAKDMHTFLEHRLRGLVVVA